MPGDFWESAAKLGDAALDFDPGPEREAFIDRACGDDSSLRTEVVKYIAGADESQPLLDSPLVPSEESPDKRIGQSVGVWRLLRVLGDGGFGVVYLGERNDGQVRQLGAVKFLKGTVRSRDIETRFLDERQILANLNHPYIVGMIDAGVTAEGQPYLVMDYVEDGKPIDIYAEEKGLSVRARIELIEKVCEAVSYANLHEVIHRDLKPSNILIATDGTPRLLDFGLAKLLNPMHRASKDEALASRIVQMGSERYMSPEQARSESTSVATDVYSLGIILFELLTGTDPYDLDRRAKENIQHVICTVEPESPSRAALRGNVVATEDTGNLNRRRKDRRRLQKDLAGDIDTILKMALRKEPERRYRSVEEFRADLERHFRLEPLVARKDRDSVSYRTSRFIRRNRTAVVVTCSLLSLIVLSTIAFSWEAHQTNIQRARAERRINDVRQFVNSFLLFYDAIANLPGSTPARKLVVAKALENLNGLAKEANNDASLKRELAAAYTRFGEVQGNPFFANLGDTAGALQSYTKAVTILDAINGDESQTTDTQRARSAAFTGLGDVNLQIGSNRTALVFYRRSLDIAENFSNHDLGNLSLQGEVSMGLLNTGYALSLLGESSNALTAYQRTLTIREAIAAAKPMDPGPARDLGVVYQRIALQLSQMGRSDEALQFYRKALAIEDRLISQNVYDAAAQRGRAVTYMNIAYLLQLRGGYEEALEYYKKTNAAFSAIAVQDPQNRVAQRDLSVSYDRIGDILTEADNKTRAYAAYNSALDIRLRLVKEDPSNTQTLRDLSLSYNHIGDVQKILLKPNDALHSYERALSIRSDLVRPHPENVTSQQDLAQSLYKVGTLLALTGKEPEALAALERARAILENCRRADEQDSTTQRYLASTKTEAGRLYVDSGQLNTAIVLLLDAASLLEDITKREPDNPQDSFGLADTYFYLGQAQYVENSLPSQQHHDAKQTTTDSDYRRSREILFGMRGRKNLSHIDKLRLSRSLERVESAMLH